jgi:hypothetical protein
MEKGTRVKLSEAGLSIHPRGAKKHGTIVGKGRGAESEGCFVVKWDGRINPVTLHTDFLEVLPEPPVTG